MFTYPSEGLCFFFLADSQVQYAQRFAFACNLPPTLQIMIQMSFGHVLYMCCGYLLFFMCMNV